ncbi:hypothetical protein TRVL_03011 [Trypanosoma vivax]|nr:hypothetical protein TRVL_03011 [Trypanosoma vivax]
MTGSTTSMRGRKTVAACLAGRAEVFCAHVDRRFPAQQGAWVGWRAIRAARKAMQNPIGDGSETQRRVPPKNTDGRGGHTRSRNHECLLLRRLRRFACAQRVQPERALHRHVHAQASRRLKKSNASTEGQARDASRTEEG